MFGGNFTRDVCYWRWNRIRAASLVIQDLICEQGHSKEDPGRDWHPCCQWQRRPLGGQTQVRWVWTGAHNNHSLSLNPTFLIQPGIFFLLRLPYTQAALAEIQRFSDITPTAIGHKTLCDVTFKGFDIPKGTHVMANLTSCHRNPEYWKKPMEFYPEHFLDKEGKFLEDKEGFIPFGVGMFHYQFNLLLALYGLRTVLKNNCTHLSQEFVVAPGKTLLRWKPFWSLQTFSRPFPFGLRPETKWSWEHSTKSEPGSLGTRNRTRLLSSIGSEYGNQQVQDMHM